MSDAPRIDLLDPASFSRGQPHDQFRWLRANAPVHRHAEPNGPGFWAVTRYEDVRAVGRDPATFSSAPTIMIADPPPGSTFDFGDHQMMLMMDPPRHTRYRRLISRAFTPRAALALRPRIELLARQIVDAVVERGACDFVTDVAGEMPSYVIADLMGLPLEDGRKLYELTETLHAAPESQPPGAALAAGARMFQYAREVIDEKRRHPRDDLATKLLKAEVDGRRLDDLDFQLFFMLLIDAGGDTTRNLVAAGVLALLERPDEHRRLLADLPRLLPSAREEMLRFVSPVVYMRRRATRNIVLGGQEISEGDKVVMYYGSANRDDSIFPDGDRLDVARAPNHHVAFGGGGAHFCLGAHIARIEIDAILREVLTRLPALELVETPDWLASTFISGPRRMPVRFRPGPPRMRRV
jgi:cytochrome P450